jgi:phospholipid/cholesterol/gamma-HCH transport system ATP-binding protein
MGMLFRRELVAFGPRELLLTSDEPVVRQFLSGRRAGPIGMSEEKDEATLAREQLDGTDAAPVAPRRVVPQLEPTPGLPPRQAVQRRRARVLAMGDQLPAAAREAVRAGLAPVQGEPA